MKAGLEVNVKTAYLGLRVFPEDEIRVNGKKVSRDDAEEDLPRVLLYNKPEGEIVSMKDPKAGRVSLITCLRSTKAAGLWSAVSTSIRKGC